jgi:hypothetical protein
MTDLSKLAGEADAGGGALAAKGSFYRALVGEFSAADPSTIISQLSSRHVAYYASAEREQVRAWEAEIALLKASLVDLGAFAHAWWLLLEWPLLRLGKRLDAVILAPGVVALIEFKMGAARFDAQAIVQTERYAQSLRDFHQASQTRLIVPILCAEKAPPQRLTLDAYDGVARLLLSNAATLGDANRHPQSPRSRAAAP